jgi:hypothetical protein
MNSCKTIRLLAARCGKSACRMPTIGPCVCSLEKVSVEAVKMMPAQMTTNSHGRKRAKQGLFHLIVGRLAGDDDVVDVAFAQAGGSDTHEAAVFLQFAQICGSAISHTAAQAAGELID